MNFPTASPPKTAPDKAAIGLINAKGSPRREYVAAIESTPVCGVAIRKEVVAALDAPWRLNETAVGKTPQEHSGKGMPIAAAFTTDFHPFPERCLVSVASFTKACKIPAIRNPNQT